MNNNYIKFLIETNKSISKYLIDINGFTYFGGMEKVTEYLDAIFGEGEYEIETKEKRINRVTTIGGYTRNFPEKEATKEQIDEVMMNAAYYKKKFYSEEQQQEQQQEQETHFEQINPATARETLVEETIGEPFVEEPFVEETIEEPFVGETIEETIGEPFVEETIGETIEEPLEEPLKLLTPIEIEQILNTQNLLINQNVIYSGVFASVGVELRVPNVKTPNSRVFFQNGVFKMSLNISDIKDKITSIYYFKYNQFFYRVEKRNLEKELHGTRKQKNQQIKEILDKRNKEEIEKRVTMVLRNRQLYKMISDQVIIDLIEKCSEMAQVSGLTRCMSFFCPPVLMLYANERTYGK